MDKQEILEKIEVAVEAGIDKYSDQMVSELLAKIAELIPGALDNVIIEAAKPELAKIAKKFLLAQAAKIDGKEG